MQTLALVMIVKNEAGVLKRCLDSVAKYVDEVVIVDTGSTDGTKEVAAAYGARIYDYEWENDFSAARNYALGRSSSDWNLVLDADEHITDWNPVSVRALLSAEPAIGRIKRIDAFQGRDGINTEVSYISRLFPAACRYSGRIHEQIESDLPRVRIDVEIAHDGYLQRQKSKRNLPILNQMIAEKPEDPYYYYQIAKEYRGLENHIEAYECLRHAYSLITRKEAYAPNLIVNYMYAMIDSGKLSDGLNVIEQEQDFLHQYADFYFVSALFLLELISGNPEQYGELLPFIERFYLRALEIGETGMEGSVIGTGSFAAHHNLGVFYEVTGQINKAWEQYQRAAKYKYAPSIDRLSHIK